MTDHGTSIAAAATRTTATSEAACTAAHWLAPWVSGTIRRLVPLDSRSTHHAYFRLAGTRRMVAIEGPAGLRLPIAITVPRPVFVRAIAGQNLTLGRRRLEIDGHSIALVCIDDARPRLGADTANARRARIALNALMAVAPHPSAPRTVWEAIERFRAALQMDDVTAPAIAAAGLIGFGPGSTPAGDDVLAAATATLTAISPEVEGNGRLELVLASLRAAIANGRSRTTPLSAALLEAAAEGYMIPRLTRCLERLVRGEPAGAAIRALCGIGTSSGYFLAVGAGLGLSAAAGATDPARRWSATPIAR